MTELADLTSDVPYRQGPSGAARPARPARPAPGRRRRAADARTVNGPVDELDAQRPAADIVAVEVAHGRLGHLVVLVLADARAPWLLVVVKQQAASTFQASFQER